MSFLPDVDGLNRGFGVSAEQTRPASDFAQGGFDFRCLNVNPEDPGGPLIPIVECVSISPGGPYTMSVGTSALLALVPGADYYAVGVVFNGPFFFEGGFAACVPAPGGETCGIHEDPEQFTSLDGDYVGSGTGSAIPSDGATVQHFVLGQEGVVFGSIDYGFGGLLLNGAPVWPIPDTAGNTYGKVLFTEAQLPGAIGAAISVANTGLSPTNETARLLVGLTPYYLGDPPPPAQQGHIIGWA